MAVETIFGWTLADKIDSQVETAENATIMLTVEKENTMNEIHKLWDLESIRIREENDVYVEFEDNVLFKDSRYQVKLPWKAGAHN